MQPNREQVATLRQNPIIVNWIATYRKYKWRKHPDCHNCGWPHDPNILCGTGAVFGQVLLGGQYCYIDASNAEYMLGFVGRLGPGFHWRNEIFFDLKDDNVTISRIDYYNGCPSVKTWEIPLQEWQSITEFLRGKARQSTGGIDG